MKGDAELAALVAAVGGDLKLELELGEAMGKFRRRVERAITDKQTADLLPQVQKATVVAERKGCHISTVYRRLQRSREKSFARKITAAKE